MLVLERQLRHLLDGSARPSGHFESILPATDLLSRSETDDPRRVIFRSRTRKSSVGQQKNEVSMWIGVTFAVLGLIPAGGLWLRLNSLSRKLAILRKSSQLLVEERKVLELIAKDTVFKDVLDSLTLAVERLTNDCMCAVFLVDRQQIGRASCRERV